MEIDAMVKDRPYLTPWLLFATCRSAIRSVSASNFELPRKAPNGSNSATPFSVFLFVIFCIPCRCLLFGLLFHQSHQPCVHFGLVCQDGHRAGIRKDDECQGRRTRK